MTLFKKYYKEANDDIETNRALISDIFEKAEKQKNSVSRAAVYRFVSCAAAVFAVCAILYLYPHMNIQNPPSGEEANARDSLIAQNNDAPESAKEQTDKNDSSDTADSQYQTSDNGDTKTDENNQRVSKAKQNELRGETGNSSAATAKDISSDSKNAADKHSNSDTPSAQNTENSAPSQEVPSASSSSYDSADSSSTVAESSVAENSKTESNSDKQAGISLFSAADTGSGGSSGNSNAKMRTDNSSFVIWNSQTYFGYLGIDVFESIKLPQDMKNTSQNEFYVQLSDDGIPLSDEGVLTFESVNGKSLTLCTSKSDYSDSFSASGYKTKSLNGVKVYYNDGEGVCTGYMYTGKAGFTFYSSDMSRAELETALTSLIK